MTTTVIPDKAKFKDSMGRYYTQGLFLETSYDATTAVYTYKEEDWTHGGVLYPSLRKLYIETADPTEYTFAIKYLWGWEHWTRMTDNAAISAHVERWREELEVKLRSKAVRSVLSMSGESFNAAKWAADGHWNIKRGRPSKDEIQREKKIRERVADESAEDAGRILHLIKKDATNA